MHSKLLSAALVTSEGGRVRKDRPLKSTSEKTLWLHPHVAKGSSGSVVSQPQACLREDRDSVPSTYACPTLFPLGVSFLSALLMKTLLSNPVILL